MILRTTKRTPTKTTLNGWHINFIVIEVFAKKKKTRAKTNKTSKEKAPCTRPCIYLHKGITSICGITALKVKSQKRYEYIEYKYIRTKYIAYYKLIKFNLF